MKTYWKCQVFVHFHSVGKEKWWQCHLLGDLKLHIKAWNKPWNHSKKTALSLQSGSIGWEWGEEDLQRLHATGRTLWNKEVDFSWQKRRAQLLFNGLNGLSVNAFLYQSHSVAPLPFSASCWAYGSEKHDGGKMVLKFLLWMSLRLLKWRNYDAPKQITLPREIAGTQGAV